MGEPRRRQAKLQSGLAGQGQANVLTLCPRRYTPARNFGDLVDLMRDAERFLGAASYADAGHRVAVLRGIYYGTVWSADYMIEHSPVRNQGFQLYTGTVSSPDDPRPFLTCNLFEALQRSQDLTNDDRRHVDFGHLMIGLHARLSEVARSATIPTQGGTGLELSTWLGDLGGGAGMLAYRRAMSPGLRANTVFTGTDFGGSINLEGDVAGFVVASPSGATSPQAPSFASGPSAITDALQTYLSPNAPSTEWNERATRFLQMYGVTPPLSTADKAELVSRLASKIEDFSVWYLANRLRQASKLKSSDVRAAATHIAGAAQEVAEIFVDALLYTHDHPSQHIQSQGKGPAPSPAGKPNAALLALAAAIDSADAVKEAKKTVDKTLDEAERRARDLYRKLWQ